MADAARFSTLKKPDDNNTHNETKRVGLKWQVLRLRKDTNFKELVNRCAFTLGENQNGEKLDNWMWSGRLVQIEIHPTKEPSNARKETRDENKPEIFSRHSAHMFTNVARIRCS